MTGIGGGSLVGAFLLAGFARRVHCGYPLFATSILSGLTLVPLGCAVSWPGVLLAAAAVGLTQSMFIALATTLLQIATPDHVRGRVLAVYLGSGVVAFHELESRDGIEVVSSAKQAAALRRTSRSSRSTRTSTSR